MGSQTPNETNLQPDTIGVVHRIWSRKLIREDLTVPDILNYVVNDKWNSSCEGDGDDHGCLLCRQARCVHAAASRFSNSSQPQNHIW
jgi:hypothetical protein